MAHQPDTTMAGLIRQVFRRSGMSIKALADRSGCCYATVHGFIRGTVDPTLTTADKLNATLGLELREVKRPKRKGG